jgi:hypothetical protein
MKKKKILFKEETYFLHNNQRIRCFSALSYFAMVSKVCPDLSCTPCIFEKAYFILAETNNVVTHTAV